MRAAFSHEGTFFPRCLLLLGLTPALLIVGADVSLAQFRPYLYMAGKAVTSESSFTDEWLDSYTEWDRSLAWELGAGIRIPGGDRMAEGVPEWEFRAGLGYGSGELGGAVYSGFISDWRTRERHPFESHESYRFRSWTVRTCFVYNVRPQYGFSMGPAVEVAAHNGRRKWDGPDGYYRGGDAEDSSTVRYGIIEVAGHVRFLPSPLVFETYWIPRRVELSTKHIRKAENWTGNFATFRESVGIRLSCQF